MAPEFPILGVQPKHCSAEHDAADVGEEHGRMNGQWAAFYVFDDPRLTGSDEAIADYIDELWMMLGVVHIL